MKNILIALIVLISKFSLASDKVLVFTKTAGYRHQSIETGVKTIKELGVENNFEVTHTENAEDFRIENLKQYSLVIFLSTSRDVLNEVEEKAFENYIKNGGSYMGIHAAAYTEYDWAWYGKLVGAYFLSHPKKTSAIINRKIKKHPATKHLPKKWKRFDEWYNYKDINNDINVLLTLDESSYKGGENSDFHPIAWYKEFDGGRTFYTGLGHTEESYSEQGFRKHLLGGIMYCLDRKL